MNTKIRELRKKVTIKRVVGGIAIFTAGMVTMALLGNRKEVMDNEEGIIDNEEKDGLYNAAYSDGHNDGYSTGYDNGYKDCDYDWEYMINERSWKK
ncbi:MAG: hypothetical protein RR420_00985 [Anaerovoracaceae bacterium]